MEQSRVHKTVSLRYHIPTTSHTTLSDREIDSLLDSFFLIHHFHPTSLQVQLFFPDQFDFRFLVIIRFLDLALRRVGCNIFETGNELSRLRSIRRLKQPPFPFLKHQLMSFVYTTYLVSYNCAWLRHTIVCYTNNPGILSHLVIHMPWMTEHDACHVFKYNSYMHTANHCQQ